MTLLTQQTYRSTKQKAEVQIKYLCSQVKLLVEVEEIIFGVKNNISPEYHKRCVLHNSLPAAAAQFHCQKKDLRLLF